MKYVLRLTMLIGGCLALQACCFGSSQPASGPGAPTPPGAPAFGLPVPSSAPVPPGAPAVGQVPAGATPPGGFTAMQLPSVPMPYAPNSFVWAGFSNTPDWSQWSFGRVRFVGAEGNHAKVQAMFRERLTPSAFVSPAIAPAALAPGAPVLYATAMPIYGRVISVAGAQAQIANGQAASYRTAPRDLETVLALQPNTWTAGHPVALAEGARRYSCILLAATPEKVWGVCSGHLHEGARADARLIDPVAHLATGARVLAQSMSGMGQQSLEAGSVTAVLNDGNAYTVTTTEGRTFDAPWPMVMAAP